MAHETLKLKRVHPTTGYSHATRAGNLLFIAGQVAWDREQKLVGAGDIQAQARQVYTNLRNILEEAGGGLGHIVKMTTYLTHPGFIESYRTVRGEFFSDPFPPNTLVIVSSLADPGFLMEVEAIAALD